MAMAEWDYFWVANVRYLCFVLATDRRPPPATWLGGVDRTFRLADVPDAHRYLAETRARGQVMITVRVHVGRGGRCRAEGFGGRRFTGRRRRDLDRPSRWSIGPSLPGRGRHQARGGVGEHERRARWAS